jgi:DNA-directed RNA polymerase subunit RPC12/RpoP
MDEIVKCPNCKHEFYPEYLNSEVIAYDEIDLICPNCSQELFVKVYIHYKFETEIAGEND